MKNASLTLLFLFCFVIFTENTACKKETVLPDSSRNTGGGGNAGGNNANRSPIASAGNDTNLWWPVNSVTLNGTGSYDPDNDKITYKWTKNYGGDGVTIENPDSAITNVTNLEAGAYLFTLTVKDSKGAEANAKVAVLVNSSYYIYVHINPPDTMIGLSSGPIPLGASAIAQDGSNNHWSPGISKVEWTKVYGPAAGSYNFQSTTNLSTQVSGLDAGTYAFQCKFTDTAGITGYGNTVISVADDAAPEQELILPNANWIGIAPLGGPELLLSLDQLPPGKAIKKVFVKQDCDSAFREASHWTNLTADHQFGFSLYYNFNGAATGLMLYVWPRDLNLMCWPATGVDTPDIKIAF